MDSHDHMNGGIPPPSSSSSTMSQPGGNDHMMMQMTFFWGKNVSLLFDGWPGTSTGMYVLCLFVIFFVAVLTEWIGHSRFIRPGSVGRAGGLVQTVMYTLRVSLAYLVMLAIMSFNGGVFVVAVVGHGLGFFAFRSKVFKDSDNRKTADVSTQSSVC